VKVDVKWGQKEFPGLVIKFDEHPDVFRAIVYSLSHVPPERQKYMLKGGQLKDSWKPFEGKITEGQKIMMVGAAEVVATPQKATLFIEDLPPDEQESFKYPPGLGNLGNTCYMNASLQCLRSLPEIGQALQEYKPMGTQDSDASLARSAAALWKELDTSKVPVDPMAFWVLLRNAYPQFDQKNKSGDGYQQQDAEEFWSAFMNALGKLNKLPATLPGANLVDQLFGGELTDTFERVDDPTDKQVKKSTFRKLALNITGTTNHLAESFELTLREEGIDMQSHVLGKSMPYVRTSKISRLPPYLTVHFLRFLWKPKEAVKAKITRPVEFSLTLDVYKYCTPELQAQLLPNRDDPGKKLEEKMDVEKKEKPHKITNNNGIYALWGVLAHLGRNADGGHYIAFVRQSDDEDDWLEFNDAKVIERSSEYILKLSGKGGMDMPIGYICLYKST